MVQQSCLSNMESISNEEIKISSKKKPPSSQDSNLKLKRCRHGRIIVKKTAAKLQASPKKASSSRPSMSPSSSSSPSSDIYDPEEPIVPISPGDSPPISPLNQAANKQSIFCNDGVKNDDEVPSSAVQLNNQEKYLKKLNRQERVVEEVKLAIKPHYQKRAITKEQYKDVMRRAVPKICHSKNGEINPIKIRSLVDAYVKKMKRRK